MGSLIAERVAKRWAAESKTYIKARGEIFEHLQHQGWTMSSPSLKIPYATSPDGTLRLWFKTQAVYYTQGADHKVGDARTISYDLDIRKMTPGQFLTRVQSWFR